MSGSRTDTTGAVRTRGQGRWGRGRAVLVVAAAAAALTVGTGCSSGGSDAPQGVAAAQLVSGGATGSPLPATEAATGSLVAGFPSSLLPLPPAATVTASAVQRHDGMREVSLTGTTTAKAPAVLDFYAKQLTRAGFTRTRDSMLPPGAVGLAFARRGGEELLVVAVVDRGSVRSFSIGGTLTGDR